MSFLRAIASYFSGPSLDEQPARTARRQQALSSTRDAFSLPQHSPLHNSSPGDFSHPFSYPPRPSSHDQARPSTDNIERPSSARILVDEHSPTFHRRGGHLLPLHHTATSPPALYPRLQHTWARLQTWLSNEFTELGDTLNYGAPPDILASVEEQLGTPLPSAVRESYSIVDGQEPESSSGCSEGLFFGLALLSLEDSLAEWSFWREVDGDPSTGANAHLRSQMHSVPPNWIKQEYSCRGWLPLATDRAGNYLGVDLDPGEGGAYGQVIIFGRDFDTKVVLRRGEGEGGWATWLASFVDDIENGTGYEVTGQQSDEGSDGSDDNVGFEGYFFNPSGGARGHGGADGGQTLRLNGQYKGWNVLEAWADKSTRAWAQIGMGLESSEPVESQQGTGLGMGLGVFPMASRSGAEIPIPVLAEDEAAAQKTFPPKDAIESNPVTSDATVHHGISTTMLHPPQPIELPTRSDISRHTRFKPLVVETSGFPLSISHSSVELDHTRLQATGTSDPMDGGDATEDDPNNTILLLSTGAETLASVISSSPPPVSYSDSPSYSIPQHIPISVEGGASPILEPIEEGEQRERTSVGRAPSSELVA